MRYERLVCILARFEWPCARAWPLRDLHNNNLSPQRKCSPTTNSIWRRAVQFFILYARQDYAWDEQGPNPRSSTPNIQKDKCDPELVLCIHLVCGYELRGLTTCPRINRGYKHFIFVEFALFIDQVCWWGGCNDRSRSLKLKTGDNCETQIA